MIRFSGRRGEVSVVDQAGEQSAGGPRCRADTARPCQGPRPREEVNRHGRRMEFFATHGRFWLPQRQRRVVHGSLTFDEDGIRLDLGDPLWAPQVRADGIVSGSPELADEAVVHGRLRDGRAVTLLRLRGWSMPADGLQETWIADFAVTGGLTSGDAFSQMVVIFDYLMPWVRPSGIIRGDLFRPASPSKRSRRRWPRRRLAPAGPSGWWLAWRGARPTTPFTLISGAGWR